MSNTIDIGMGQLTVERSPSVITTGGVGSCMVVCLYSATQQAGAMAHVMLPKRFSPETPIDETQYKFADVAIIVMLQKLEAMGIRKTSLVAKIVGGSNMFPEVQGRSQRVGEKNIEAVKEFLMSSGVTVASEHTGGTVGRTVAFDVGNGIVSIRINI